MPTVLIVSGLPCAGKSTVAHRLRDELGWPLLAKDAIKEMLFDSLGWRDRAWSKRVSGASYALMFGVARDLLAAGQSFILEGNFRWVENEHRFSELRAVRAARFIQVFCTAADDALVARLRARIEAEPLASAPSPGPVSRTATASGKRHPGHVDRESAAELEAELREHPLQPLPLGERPLVFDSTSEDVGRLDRFIAAVVSRATSNV